MIVVKKNKVESRKFSPQKFKVLILLSIVLLIFAIIQSNIPGGNKENSTEINNHSVVYEIEAVGLDDIVRTKSKIMYNLDNEKKNVYSGKSEAVYQPQLSGTLLHSSSFPGEILYLLETEDNIKVVKFNNNTKTIIDIAQTNNSKIFGTENMGEFSFSPDGTKLAYIHSIPIRNGMDAINNIFIWNLASNEIKQITSFDSYNGAREPHWSGNNKIIFGKYYEGDYSLQIIDINSNKQEMLLEVREHQVPNTLVQYAYANDGKEIIFNSYLNTEGENILSLNVSSKEIKKLFHLPYYDFTYPKITNDSKYLIWRSLVTGEFGSQSIFSYDLTNGKQNTICASDEREWCGDFYLLEP